MKCQYCGKNAEWVENKEIYGRNYGKSYMIWLCRDCDAYVGCHNNTQEPFGTLANKELREFRKQAKSLWIEKMLNGNWQDNKLKIIGYDWLGKLFNKEFHFGSSTIEECKIVISNLATTPYQECDHPISSADGEPLKVRNDCDVQPSPAD